MLDIIYVCVCVCVHACVRACLRARVCVCLNVLPAYKPSLVYIVISNSAMVRMGRIWTIIYCKCYCVLLRVLR